MTGQPARKPRSHRRVALLGVTAIAVMLGLTYASVPLYRLFCQATGFDGATVRGETADLHGLVTDQNRSIAVRFDANTDGKLDWDFAPEQPKVDAHPGEQKLIFYRAANRGAAPVTGHALFNVTPEKAGQYFVKVACFCFTEQTLKPGEAVDMPVTFYIDPAIAKDRNLDDVKTITLSYTFFRADEQDPAGTTTGIQRNTAAETVPSDKKINTN